MIPVGTLLFVLCVTLAVVPVRRPRTLALFSWIVGSVPNELPFVALAFLAVSVGPALVGGDLPQGGRGELALNVVAVAGLVVVVRRALGASRVLDGALDDALGHGWRADIDPVRAGRLRRRRPWRRIVLFALPVRPRDVERTSNIAYGDAGKSNLLDVYRHRSHPNGAPTLIHLHGGRFRWGAKSREARPLLHRLASQGWTCISANYHLSHTPGAGFPDHLVDAKRIIAWARTEGAGYGVDADTIFLAGSSAGAHLTAMSALTAGDPRFQPGFEQVDTSITAGIGLYGYYGPLDDAQPTSSPRRASPARRATLLGDPRRR